MTNKQALTRRALLVPGVGLLLLQSRGARALTPPPPPPPTLRDLVKAADAACVAKAERYVYRGIGLGQRADDDYGRDFEENDAAGNRTLDVILRVREWLYGAAELRSPVIRVTQPLGSLVRDPALMQEHLYLLSQGNLYTGPTGTHRVLRPIARPLPIAPRRQLGDLLNELLTTGEKK